VVWGKNLCLFILGKTHLWEKTFCCLHRCSRYLVFVAVVGKTQCFGKKPCCLSVYRLHRVAANLVVVSICCISLIVGVVAIGLLLIGVVVVVDVTFFALAASTTVHY